MLMIFKHEASVHLSGGIQQGESALYLEGGEELCKHNAVWVHRIMLTCAEQGNPLELLMQLACPRCCQHYALMHRLWTMLVTTLFHYHFKPTVLST